MHSTYITVTHRSFITIKLLMICLLIGCSLAAGYWIGMRRVEVAQQFGHDAALSEYPSISLMQSGVTFCFDRGNIYQAELVPMKRAMMPHFRTVVE